MENVDVRRMVDAEVKAVAEANASAMLRRKLVERASKNVGETTLLSRAICGEMQIWDVEHVWDERVRWRNGLIWVLKWGI